MSVQTAATNLKTDLRLDWCTHAAAKYAVEHWHYSRTMPKSKLVKVGVWEKEKFVGAVVFGVGATRDLVKRYGLKPEHGCELVRVALREHKSQVSRIVSIAIRLLGKSCPSLRMIVSFADPEKGHNGGIYQAGNWIYCGKSASSTEYIYKGKRWQGRSFRNSFKGMENHPCVQKVMGTAKHRYLMPLDKEMRTRLLPLGKPYPKREKQAMAGPPAQRQCDSDLLAPRLEESNGATP